ncbi:hypothetical protein PVAP13_1KG483805 [Panicum virgatum]|uniref:Uncharacterized protein n=1 Tax=Panicum virgatum TaxID=38727 RepID=A0A8T0Y116_PANVG|nr:hypothetical protein PVAP13_1KG483805 [Panicum virgatum]
MDGLYVTSRSTSTAPRLIGTTLKSKLKNLRVVRRNGCVSGLQDLVANVAFWLEGVSFQWSWATVGIVATLLVSFGREEPVIGRPFLEGRIL